MRSMVYTAKPATAAELHHYGSVLRVVPHDELVDAAYEVAEDIAATARRTSSALALRNRSARSGRR